MEMDAKLPEYFVHATEYLLGVDAELLEDFVQGSDQLQINHYKEDLLGVGAELLNCRAHTIGCVDFYIMISLLPTRTS